MFLLYLTVRSCHVLVTAVLLSTVNTLVLMFVVLGGGLAT